MDVRDLFYRHIDDDQRPSSKLNSPSTATAVVVRGGHGVWSFMIGGERFVRRVPPWGLDSLTLTS
eukprot:CAMPEP_0113468224 /NCGR_PEP_ID=MMETSP0014_2-20120614/15239_1 /TAXON_ID=2857 /ORGANISM="Nitzschia sp." /LENGTH=64 /DNA_ID=CAMNT_0000360595 /DNA_START=541 /DNA_END=732 /DNA_ORIENTATION=+ /assembly_acc=CAM_ASM_000159